MSTAHQASAARPWLRLFLHDLRRLIPAQLALFLLTAAGLLTLNAIGFLQDLNLPGESDVLVVWSIAPVCSALLAAALLFGQDRELRSWNWLSSLPVGPGQSLSARFVASALVALVTLVLAWWGFWMTVPGRMAEYPWWPNGLVAALFWLQGWCLFSIAVLLLDSALRGLFVGGAAVLAWQMITPRFVENAATALQLGGPRDSVNAWLLLLAVLMQGVLLGAMIAVHAWRWNSGCHVDVPSRVGDFFSRRHLASGHGIAAPGRRAGATLEVDQPQPPVALLWNSWRQYRTVKLLALATLAVAWVDSYFATRTGAFQGTLSGLFSFAMAALGLAAFHGDVERKRVRFLSDRGVSPFWFWLSRVAPVTLVAVIVAAGVCMVQKIQMPDRIWLATASILALMVCMLAGLVCRSAVLGLFAAAGSWWLLAATVVATDFLWFAAFQYPPPAATRIGIGYMLALVFAGLAASFWFCRRHFVHAEPLNGRRALALLGLVVAVLVAARIGENHAWLPKTEWNGGTQAEIAGIVEERTAAGLVQWRVAGLDAVLMDPATALFLNHVNFLRLDDSDGETRLVVRAVPPWRREGDRDIKSPSSEEDIKPLLDVIHDLQAALNRLLDQPLEQVTSKEAVDGQVDYMNTNTHIVGQLVQQTIFLLDQRDYQAFERSVRLLLKFTSLVSSKSGSAFWEASFRRQLGQIPPYITDEHIRGLGGAEKAERLLRPLFEDLESARNKVRRLATLYRYAPELVDRAYHVTVGQPWVTIPVPRSYREQVRGRLLAVDLETANRKLDEIRMKAEAQKLSSTEEVSDGSTFEISDWIVHGHNWLMSFSMTSLVESAAAWELHIKPLLEQCRDEEMKDRQKVDPG